MLFLNYLYDFKSLCTSIVARTPAGKIIHGRNLDYAFPDFMRKILYVGQFYRGDEYLFDAVMMAGHIGVYTAVRDGAFSISFNARTTDHMSIENWLDQALLVMEGGLDLSWNVRDVMTNCHTYACAYKNLLNYPTLSPGYIIMAGLGPNEGAVIARDRDGPANVQNLSEDNWFIVQTNDDSFRGICQERCTAGNANMNKIGREGMSEARLMEEVVLVGPNLNKMTIFSSLLIPADKRFDAMWIDSDYPYYH